MAEPVYKDSNDCSSSGLDLLLLPPTQSSFHKGKSSIIIQSHHSQMVDQ